MRRGLGSVLMKGILALMVGASVPMAGLMLGGSHPLTILGRGALGSAAQDAGIKVHALLTGALDKAGLKAISGGGPMAMSLGMAPPEPQRPLVVQTWTPDQPPDAPAPGSRLSQLKVTGSVSGSGGAILSWPDGKTFLARPGQLLPGMDARVASITATEVVLEQRIATADGHELRTVRLPRAP